jgi:hypothetical protein
MDTTCYGQGKPIVGLFFDSHHVERIGGDFALRSLKDPLCASQCVLGFVGASLERGGSCPPGARKVLGLWTNEMESHGWYVSV